MFGPFFSGIGLVDIMEPEVRTPTSLTTSLRFQCSSKLVPGQWHHLVVVMAKDVKKSCMVSVYFNGKALGTGKVCQRTDNVCIVPFTACIHASQPVHFLSDEVHSTIPRSACLHGPHSCGWCVWTDRNAGVMEGACSSHMASGSFLPVWRGFEPRDRGDHIHTRHRLPGQLPGSAQSRCVARSMTSGWSVYRWCYLMYSSRASISI